MQWQLDYTEEKEGLGDYGEVFALCPKCNRVGKTIQNYIVHRSTCLIEDSIIDKCEFHEDEIKILLAKVKQDVYNRSLPKVKKIKVPQPLATEDTATPDKPKKERKKREVKEKVAKIPKKRGRKPKENVVPKIKGKRGRPKKVKDEIQAMLEFL